MRFERVVELVKKNVGEIIGGIIGLIVGILFLTIGFVKTIFLILCISLGVFIGGRFYEKKKLIDFLERHLPW